MKLLKRNPLLANANVEGVSCRSDSESLTAGLVSETGDPSDETGSSPDRPFEGR